MKMFMKMLKSKNKKSTKQVPKNRNTKKNKKLNDLWRLNLLTHEW